MYDIIIQPLLTPKVLGAMMIGAPTRKLQYNMHKVVFRLLCDTMVKSRVDYINVRYKHDAMYKNKYINAIESDYCIGSIFH